jgi:hypothetical protein
MAALLWRRIWRPRWHRVRPSTMPATWVASATGCVAAWWSRRQRSHRSDSPTGRAAARARWTSASASGSERRRCRWTKRMRSRRRRTRTTWKWAECRVRRHQRQRRRRRRRKVRRPHRIVRDRKTQRPMTAHYHSQTLPTLQMRWRTRTESAHPTHRTRATRDTQRARDRSNRA